MSMAERVPLGFSDLTQDECLVIALFRKWHRMGPTRAIAEHRLACLLQADTIHPALDSLFRLFSAFPLASDDRDGETDLLSEGEEMLLDLLSDQEHPEKDLALVRECRRDIESSEIRLRPSSAIERTGEDRILLRTADSFQLMSGLLRRN